MISVCNFTLSEMLDYDINYIINFGATPIQYDIVRWKTFSREHKMYSTVHKGSSS